MRPDMKPYFLSWMLWWTLPTAGVCICCSGISADDWPQFLGMRRNGTSAETDLLDHWPASGPKIHWRAATGAGMSGVAVVGRRVFTLCQDDSRQYTVAIDSTTGQECWRTPLAPRYENAMGHGPRATPAVDSGQVFVFTGEGILESLNAEDGRILWSVEVMKNLVAEVSEYGMSCSPIVVGEAVVVHSGAKEAAIAAFDRRTGQKLWDAGKGAADYSSPVMMTLAGKEQLIAFVGAGLLGVDAATGHQLWDYPFVTDYNCNTASPVQIGPDAVLISAGENHGAATVKISQDGGEDLKASELWTSFGTESQLRAEWQTPVVVDGCLYGLDNVGAAGPITSLVCIRLADRKTMWRKPRFGKSNLIAADGRLYIYTLNGDVVIVNAVPDAFEELGRAHVSEGGRQAPALSDGRLYVRDNQEIVCIDVLASSAP